MYHTEVVPENKVETPYGLGCRDGYCMEVGTDGHDEFYKTAAYFRQTQAIAPVDDGGDEGQKMVLKDVKNTKMPRILGGGSKTTVTNREVGSPTASKVSGLSAYKQARDIIVNGMQGLMNEFDAEPEEKQRKAYYMATQLVDAKLGETNTGAFRSDLINYVTDGTLPTAKQGMTVDQKKSFGQYVDGIVKTGNSIMKNNNIPIQSNDNIPSQNKPTP